MHDLVLDDERRDGFVSFLRALIVREMQTASFRFGIESLSQFSMAINFTPNGSARGVVVIVLGNEHGDTSSNPGRDWLHFTYERYESNYWERYESNYSPSSYG